ncbi:MAG: glycoside-pentoside-hexuronide (GPH):cation symporter [Spirochaetaceae bacterium]|jgi:sugar (glycoside-pentoside-hexuronide) transporter|nr:glycoside-pentoside-hexuronide (GPH):cation symporter [Spirochaetaceae bacterium]
MDAKNVAGPDKLTAHTSLAERGSYGLYFVGQNIVYVLVAQYLMLYYTDYRYMTPAAVGLILLLARIWDAVNDPLFGIVVDKMNLKGGKFKPWIRIATVGVPVSIIAAFGMPEGLSGGAQVVYACVTYLLYDTLYTLTDVPIFALATAMTNNIKERTVIMGIGRMAAALSMLLLSMVVMPVIIAAGWSAAAVLFAVAAFILMIPLNFLAKERFRAGGGGASLKDIVTYLRGNKYLLIFYTAMIVCSLTNTVMSMNGYIGKYMLGGPQMIPFVMVTMTLPMIIASFLIPIINKKVDKFNILMAGLILNMASSAAAYFAGYGSLPLFLTLNALRNFGFGAFFATSGMFTADCVEYGNYKTGKRAEGITFSIQTFSAKLTSAFSAGILGILMTIIGYNGAEARQAASTMAGLWKMFTLMPLIGLAIAIPVIGFLYKLRDKDVQVMALYNQRQLTEAEAEAQLSRKY